ncbi:MAG TPA: hypothetical protein ENK48_03595 [Gammaproteobacteria bacterium]|nr:hypothetical protein [Gammaproteobacteria bacterium]
MNEHEEREFAASLGRLLDRAAALDEETAALLAARRRRALEAARRSDGRPWVQWGGLAAVAASALLVMGLWWGQSVPPSAMPAATPLVEDLELLSTREDLEFFEDLDFYLWLEDEQQAG